MAETRPEPPAGPPGNVPPTSAAVPPGPRWRRLLIRWLKRLAITVVVLAVFSGVMLALAEHRTSQPDFCASCHIMEPYYASWHADLHGGKLDVACVDCHYAPGERTTVKAQLRGLSQVASYVSGRYGQGRPRAHVDNRSCLTSKCHGDMQFMDKEFSLGTVKFTHAKHLRFDEKKREATGHELEALTQALRQELGAEPFAEVEEAAREAVPMQTRIERMTRAADQAGKPVERERLARFSELQHRQVRIAQLDDLQCTNCHSYVAPLAEKPGGRPPAPPAANGSHHFTVKTTACYVCHFNNEGFNLGTASCLTCHSLPTKEIIVHKETAAGERAKPDAPELGKQTVRMDHRMILERKVSCIACHADVATEDSKVLRRDCLRCHDRPDYFEGWKEPLSVDLVKHYHAVHVPEQRAKCLDCHSEIHHQLVREPSAAGQPGFLTAAMSDCIACHPGQHAEQVKLLSGEGGLGVPKSDPNLMFGARTNCFGCHLEQATTEHAGVTARGSVTGCVSCHGDRHTETFDKWKKSLQVATLDANEAYDKAKKALEEAKDLPPETRRKARELLSAARSDLQLVKRGNGLHNLMYAIELLDSVTQRCQEAMALASGEGGADR
jgi:nitrate/TMAO reductase-like tetraheme cytochrome c subunit